MAPPTRFPSGATAVLDPSREGPRRAHGGAPPRRRRGGGGDGGRGDGDGYVPAGGGFEGAGKLALGLALAGITTLFLVLIAVWLLLRRPAPDWRAAASPAPHALWLSTAFLLASGAAVELAARRARRGASARTWLVASVALGLAFLGAQAQLWAELWRAGLVPASSGYAAVFFALTGLHALHVLGGLGFLAFLARAPGAASVRLGAVYWHFMGALWVVLFTLLYFVR